MLVAMKANYCIARVCQLLEGYASKAGDPKPINVKLTMEPNPYTPVLEISVSLNPELADGIKVGDRVRVDFRSATEEEFEEFKAKTANPAVVAS